MTEQQATADMNSVARQLAREFPITNEEVDAATVISLPEFINGDIRSPLLLLMSTVSFVLLIACANVANLLLVRGAGRRGEIAIRIAIGAGRQRLLRQFITESLLLAFAGAACGVALAFGCVQTLLNLFPQNLANVSIPRIERIPMDWHVLGFTLFVCIATGLFFGLLPALELVRSGKGVAIKETSRSMAGSVSSGRIRNILTGSEVAISVVLLVAAGLMLKSLAHLMSGNLGVNPNHVLTLRLVLPADQYSKPSKLMMFSDELLNRLRRLPGVQSAGTVTFLPLSGWLGSPWRLTEKCLRSLQPQYGVPSRPTISELCRFRFWQAVDLMSTTMQALLQLR